MQTTRPRGAAHYLFTLAGVQILVAKYGKASFDGLGVAPADQRGRHGLCVIRHPSVMVWSWFTSADR